MPLKQTRALMTFPRFEQVKVNYKIEVKGKRKETLASNPKIAIPIRIQTSSRPPYKLPPDGPRMEDDWFVVDSLEEIDGIGCLLSWRITRNPSNPSEIVLLYRVVLPLSSDSILANAAQALLDSTRVSVTKKVTLKHWAKGARWGCKRWESSAVAIPVRKTQRGEVRVVDDGNGYAIWGSLHVGLSFETSRTVARS